MSIPIDAGVYSVSVAYVDIFGEGPRTDAKNVTVKAKIDSKLLDMEELGISDMDKAVKALKNEVGTVKTSVDGFQSKLIDQANAFQHSISDLNTNLGTQITQISNGIELKVSNAINSLDGAALVSRINLSPAGTRIDGKLLHVTGAALFDDNIITKKMLQAGSVTADKMQVDSLSTITANVGDLKGGTITGGTFKNTNNSFRIDPNGNIVGANITASRIDATSIFQSGYRIKNIDVQVYKVRHGDWCPIPNGFTEEQCTFVPVGYVQTESYFLVNSRYRKNNPRNGPTIEESEYERQKSRYIGSCNLYMLQEIERGAHVGIAGKRRAVVEARSSSVWSGGGDNGNTYSATAYSYGELYILVIAKQ